jgi:3-methyladenine DNA glycosylase AlkD
MSKAKKILDLLQEHANGANLQGMSRFGMTVEKRLGVTVPEMREIAKESGKDHKAAKELWNTGIIDAKIVASMIADPGEMTEKDMETWVMGFDSWDVCDQTCMNLFEKTPFARKKIAQWAKREEEYVKRAAFALIACLAWHDKKAPDEEFIGFFDVIKKGSTDERNYVRKAVNWALRNIGKRNPALNRAAIKTAGEIKKIDSKAARWIAADALRELAGQAVQARLKKKG